MKKLIFTLIFPVLAFGQGSQLPKYTVATLPTASLFPTYTVQVTDGLTAVDCTSGGGTFNVLCTSHGGAWNSVAQASGTTTNPLTMNNSGTGDTSGSTFNGSAAKTISYNTIGAQQALTLTTTGTSGPSTLVSGTLNIPQYSGGSGGANVQYNASSTTYTITGSSVNGDDNHLFSSAITITGGSSSGGVCTMTNSGTNSLSTGDWVYVGGVTGWPAQGAAYGVYTYGSGTVNDDQFQVIANGLSSTQFEFNCPNAGSVTFTGGSAYASNYWFTHQVEKTPYFNGHGTVNAIFDSTHTCAGINTNFSTLFPNISGHIGYLILTDCHNEYNTGVSAATVKGYIQSIAAKAHTAGYLFVLGTTPNAQISGLNNGSYSFALNTVNWWSYTQGKSPSNATSGQYWDFLADFNSALSNYSLYGGNNSGLGSPAGNPVGAAILNETLALQGWSPKTQWTSACYFGWYSGVLASNSGPGIVCSPASNRDAFVVTNGDQSSIALEVDTAAVSSVELGIRAAHVSPLNIGSTTSPICTDSNGYLTASGCTAGFSNPMTTLGDTIYGGVAGAATRLAGPATAASHQYLFGELGGATTPAWFDLGATLGTYITVTSPIVKTQNSNDLNISCPTCGTSTSTAVQINGGSTLGTLNITGNTTQACPDSSGSGTAQTCNTSTSFTVFTNACVVYTTTTTNSGTGLTVNVNSVGAKSVAIPGASGWTTTLTANIIPANKPLTMCYDGTNWNVQQTGTASTGSSGALTNITGTVTVAGCTVTSGACVVTGSPAASVTFSSIPGTYNNIIVKFVGQTSNASDEDMWWQFNADTGNNYDWAFGNTSSPTYSAGHTTTTGHIETLFLSHTGGPSQSRCEVNSYAATTFFKEVRCLGVAYNAAAPLTQDFGGNWHSTAAITSIKMQPLAGSFVVGSTLEIYGEQ